MTLAKKLKLKPKDNAPHLIVLARAGTGKTTTLVEGLKVLRGLGGSPIPPSGWGYDDYDAYTSFTPSPQQKAIWDSLCLSPKDSSVCFVAFNKSIATELQQRVPEDCDAMTMHSMGFKAVKQRFELGENGINQYRVRDIIAKLLNKDVWELRKRQPELLKATERLVSLCKMNLIGFKEGVSLCGPHEWYQCLAELAAQYDVDVNANRYRVSELVPRVLERCKDVAKDGCIDFDDMIWLPIVLDLAVTRYDLLLVDECQDLNRCQQQLALKAGNRLILCGDNKQAIYGFAGADSKSMERMYELLSKKCPYCSGEKNHQGKYCLDCKGTMRIGCQLLPLTVTRRCGRAIVKEAQKLVPDFEAHESCGEGTVLAMELDQGENPHRYYQDAVHDGDMVLCRCNAPLVSECFKFLKMGRKANIIGRDIGQGLISTIRKVMKTVMQEGDRVELLMGGLSRWHNAEERKENTQLNPNEAKLIALQDRYDCLCTFCEGVKTVEDVIKRIDAVFTGNKESEGIRLSSGHRAKGLEADRVFILMPEGAKCPHPLAKTPSAKEQEWNILYVMITRARKELVYVS